MAAEMPEIKCERADDNYDYPNEDYAEHMRKLTEREDRENMVGFLKTEPPEEAVEATQELDITNEKPLEEVQVKVINELRQLLFRNQQLLPKQPEIQRSDFTPMQVNEMRQFLASNVIVDIPIVAEMFSHRFGRKIDPGLLNAWRQQGLAEMQRERERNSSPYNQIEECLLHLIDEAATQGKRLSREAVQTRAIQLAKQFRLENINPNWLGRFLVQYGHKLAKTTPPRRTAQDKRKSFIRLTFGEKHEISTFIIKNPKWPVRAYAEHFTKLWNRQVTQKQIEVTKDNRDKWSQDKYKNATQSYEKFERKSSIRLSRSEREEIAEFITLRGRTMTLEETARIFSSKWKKDVNRTHIARIKNHARVSHDDHDDFDHYHRQPVGPPPVESAPRGLTIGSTIGQMSNLARPGVSPAMPGPAHAPPPPPPTHFMPAGLPQTMRPERPQAPAPLPHKMLNNFMINHQMSNFHKFPAKECYNNNPEDMAARQRDEALFGERQKLTQRVYHPIPLSVNPQKPKPRPDSPVNYDSGISVESVSPEATDPGAASVIQSNASYVNFNNKSGPNRGSVIVTKSSLTQYPTPERVKRESHPCPAEKVFNCPECDWQSYDNRKFMDHLRENHFKEVIFKSQKNQLPPPTEDPEVIDIKTQPIDNDDIIMYD